MNKAIILVSFGTTNIYGIEKSINVLISELNYELMGEYKIFTAFTSDMIRKKLQENTGLVISSLNEILEELSNLGYEEVFVKPLHVFDGNEIINIKIIVDNCKNTFKKIHIGKSLLGYNDKELIDRCTSLADILIEDIQGPILFIGHGSKTANYDKYDILINHIRLKYTDKVFFGTLEGKESINKVIENLNNEGIRKITILPLFIINGKHINKDIVFGKNSWKSIFAENGIENMCINKSLLEYQKIRYIICNEIKKNV